MSSSGHFYPSAQVGPYEVASRLGRGFVSEVWLAYRPDGDGRMQAMALKRLHHKDPALHGSFLEAVRRAEHMDHPNLVHVFSSFVHEDEAIAVLEFVDGLNLRELVSAQAGLALDPKTAVWIARECVRASYEAQVQVTGTQMDHGHLVSSNVLLGRDGVVRVSDFIVARTTNDPRLVGDLGRPAERDAISAARILVGLLALVPPEDLRAENLLEAARAFGRTSIESFVESCLAEGSGQRLRELEEDLGRIFYAELSAHEIKDGTPAISNLVRRLLPAVETERGRLDTSGFLPFARDDASAAPTIATKASFGFTQMIEARNEPVVPSPLTGQDIPTGFTRDVELVQAGLRPSSESSEASTDEDLPGGRPSPDGPKRPGGLRTPALPAQAHRNPPPAVSVSASQSTSSNPGHVGATMSAEIQIPWMQKVAPIALAFSVGVAGTAGVFAYFLMPKATPVEVAIEPQRVEAPRVEVPRVEAPAAVDLDALMGRIEALPKGDAERARLFETAAAELRSRVEASALDARAKRAASGTIEQAVAESDAAMLSKARRMIEAPRRAKLAPAEEL